MLKTRQQLEEEENARLAPYAMKNSQSLGRLYKEKEDNGRMPFQRDRDRIIHCRAFRRLQAKTQVFVSYFGDHYRDRLTHSIEVAQIARDISRRLSLNEDLSECIALAHDLGHPPFGHGGEDALNESMQKYGLHFEHNEQSRRIIEKLEKLYPGFDGLNPTVEVLDGLLKHNPHKYETHIKFVMSPHLESQVADLSDEIAYTNHDLDDGLRSGIITMKQLKDFKLWNDAEKQVYEIHGKQAFSFGPDGERRLQSRTISRMIGRMIEDLQYQTESNLNAFGIDSIEKVRIQGRKIVSFSDAISPHLAELRDFLHENFYYHPTVHAQIEKGRNIIKELFIFYGKNPQKLPDPYLEAIKSGERPEIVIKDYIAGMTDHYAEEKFNENL
ncbi:deoxyguanosinetriphosphate triphosphohydrolase [Patescibacteria group bacterium]|nr:deoxyguanosinetriphosphate triphosphohydrolase [Patescibacteria group bacterium]MBU1703214.1 deoxyguanosinetriphosphate triphosphohydrolase [Patescibacteria group bacterium]MBU1953755.1 deoxyguanosinetriphosphate triphosphohydrolase [Patescibacteria group bacterium]